MKQGAVQALRSRWQLYNKRRALARAALHGQGSPLEFGQFAGDEESQSGAFESAGQASRPPPGSPRADVAPRLGPPP